MSAENWIRSLERFFVDLIGVVLPGAVLIIGLQCILSPFPLRLTPPAEHSWAALAVISYIAGHAVTSGGKRLVTPLLAFLGSKWPFKCLKGWSCAKWACEPWGLEQLGDAVLAGEAFKSFKKLVDSRMIDARMPPLADGQPNSAARLSQWRSFAMTLIGQDERETVYRFMSISLFSLGTATALLVTLAVKLGTLAVAWWSGISVTPAALLPASVWPGIAIASLLLLERHQSFYVRAHQVPFSMATASLVAPVLSARISPESGASAWRRAGRLQVYLAGGMKSGWQAKVTGACEGIEFRDPRRHGLEDPSAYTLWDLQAIRQCDMVFAYLEAENPGGYGLALEVGYARALGMHVVFVNERADRDGAGSLAMVEASADVTFSKLADGVEFLKKFLDPPQAEGATPPTPAGGRPANKSAAPKDGPASAESA